MDSLQQHLSQHPYFRDLAAVQLVDVARVATIRRLDRGEILSLEGDPCTAVHLCLQGRVRALKISPEGREQVVAELQPGEAFYVAPALDGGTLPVTTQAATRVTLISIPRQDFVDLLRRHSSAALAVSVELARKLRGLSSLAEDLALYSVPKRLARLLVRGAESPTRYRLTQREMAIQIGSVREVVARALAQFERQGSIRLGRGIIEILDLDALRQDADI